MKRMINVYRLFTPDRRLYLVYCLFPVAAIVIMMVSLYIKNDMIYYPFGAILFLISDLIMESIVFTPLTGSMPGITAFQTSDKGMDIIIDITRWDNYRSLINCILLTGITVMGTERSLQAVLSYIACSALAFVLERIVIAISRNMSRDMHYVGTIAPAFSFSMFMVLHMEFRFPVIISAVILVLTVPVVISADYNIVKIMRKIVEKTWHD